MNDRTGVLCGWIYQWYYGNSIIVLSIERNYVKVIQYVKMKKQFKQKVLYSDMFISGPDLQKRWLQVWREDVNDLIASLYLAPDYKPASNVTPFYTKIYYKHWNLKQGDDLYIITMYGSSTQQITICHYKSHDNFSKGETLYYERNLKYEDAELSYTLATQGHIDELKMAQLL